MLLSTLERRLEEKERRRNEIVDAAEEVFSEKGTEKATIGDVAKKARLSRGLIYFYFKDKDELNLAVALRATAALKESFEKAVAKHETGLDQIEAIGRAYVTFNKTQPLYFQAIAAMEARHVSDMKPGSIEKECVLQSDGIFQIMVESVNRGVEDGSIRENLGDPMLTSISLWGFTHGLIQIMAQKSEMLEECHGVPTKALFEQGFTLMRQMLQRSA